MSDKDISRSKLTNIVGLGLIIVGVLLFGLQRSSGLTAENWWPFFVIAPGVAILAAALMADVGGRHTVEFGAAVTSVGLLLLYQNTFQHFESWAYGWALVFPTSIGFAWGLFGSAKGDDDLTQRGRRYVLAGLAIFAVGLTFFEFFVGISGKALFVSVRESLLWPLGLVAVGVALVLLSGKASDS